MLNIRTLEKNMKDCKQNPQIEWMSEIYKNRLKKAIESQIEIKEVLINMEKVTFEE